MIKSSLASEMRCNTGLPQVISENCQKIFRNIKGILVLAEKDFQPLLFLAEILHGNPVAFQYFIAGRTGQMFLNGKAWLANFG